MKIYLPLILPLLLMLLPLQAQPSLQDLQQPLTVKTYQIQKVYEHRLGYRVDLINDYGTLQTVYVKSGWLYDPKVKKAELFGDFILQRRIPSYMVFYIREGKVVRFSAYVQSTFAGHDTIISATDTDATDADFDSTTLEIGGVTTS